MGPRQRNMRSRAKTHATSMIVASIFGFMLLTGIAFGVGMIGVVETWLQDLPDYENADLYLNSEPTVILDADGNEIASFYTQNRSTISIDQVSKYVLDGTVATEDERFYEHNGVDFVGIMRAVMVQLTGGSEGASTITQQLVRNTILSDEQFDITLERKVREAYLALKVEEIYSKEEILMMYLNTIFYGHGAYGIEAASQTYFSKSAADLTLAEAALLIGLPNAPSQYDPTVNPDLALQRRNTVLDRMLRNGCISQEEHDAAQAAPLELNVTEMSDTGVNINAYPYFVDYVRSLLEDEFGYDQIFSGGLTVHTTIDPDAQQAAETAVTERLAVYDEPDLDAGMTIIDNETGAIVAMVGGKDYYADSNHINHATAQRQTGSAFKAFTLATAIDQGMNPDITINCGSPMEFDDGTYRVENYGNHNYGYISLARATEVSSNTGYVQVAKAVGVQNVVDMCHNLGIEDHMNAYSSLTLGTQSLSTLQMAEAYSTLATGGIHRDAIAITSIENRDGETIYEAEDTSERVLDADVASTVTDILQGVVSRGTATTARLSVNQPFAGKTGTTDLPSDLWFCGYTPQYSLAVWCGHSGGSTRITVWGRQATTADLPLPMARDTLNALLEGVEREEFPEGGTPTYRDNDVWEVDGEPLENMHPETEEPETEEPATEEVPTTEQPATEPNAPVTSPSNPNPPATSTTDPNPPATSTTDPNPPVTSTTPGGTGDGTGNATQ